MTWWPGAGHTMLLCNVICPGPCMHRTHCEAHLTLQEAARHGVHYLELDLVRPWFCAHA